MSVDSVQVKIHPGLSSPSAINKIYHSYWTCKGLFYSALSYRAQGGNQEAFVQLMEKITNVYSLALIVLW